MTPDDNVKGVVSETLSSVELVAPELLNTYTVCADFWGNHHIDESFYLTYPGMCKPSS